MGMPSVRTCKHTARWYKAPQMGLSSQTEYIPGLIKASCHKHNAGIAAIKHVSSQYHVLRDEMFTSITANVKSLPERGKI